MKDRFLAVKDKIEANLPTRGGKTRALAKEDFSQQSSIFLQPEAQFDYLVLTDREDLDEEESRAVRESLDEESSAIFDLLKKGDLNTADVKWIKTVTVRLQETLKAEKLRVDQLAGKGGHTRRSAGNHPKFPMERKTGLPVDSYTEDDVQIRSDEVFRHVFRAYPTVPSPYYPYAAAA